MGKSLDIFTWVLYCIELSAENNGTIVQNKILCKRNLTTLRKYPPKSDACTNICVHTTKNENLVLSDKIKS